MLAEMSYSKSHQYYEVEVEELLRIVPRLLTWVLFLFDIPQPRSRSRSRDDRSRYRREYREEGDR